MTRTLIFIFAHLVDPPCHPAEFCSLNPKTYEISISKEENGTPEKTEGAGRQNQKHF